MSKGTVVTVIIGLCLICATSRADNIPLGAQAIIDSYPQFFDKNAYKDNCLIWKDGTRMKYDDGVKKNYMQRLDDADIEDSFHDIYDVSLSPDIPYLHDPGRTRCDAMFK